MVEPYSKEPWPKIPFMALSCQIEKNRKYAKWKAAYIHNCVKNGETPHAGPLEEGGGDSLTDDMGLLLQRKFDCSVFCSEFSLVIHVNL